MKQKKLLVWGIVLACVMLTADLSQSLVLGIELYFADLLFSIVMPAAVCVMLVSAVNEKRVLGIVSSAVALAVETIGLINFCSLILRYGFNASFLFSLLMRTVCMTVAVLWFLRFILNRPMKTLLLVVTIVGASLGITIDGVEMLRVLVMVIKGSGYGALIIANLCSTLYEAAFWTILLLAACGQSRHTAKAVSETVEVFDEPFVEPAAETVPAAEEETVPMPAQEEPMPSESALDALERLAKLHERGILTEAEFESKKAELLSKI